LLGKRDRHVCGATGDWRLTAPTVARDTVFVGGDALYTVAEVEDGETALVALA